VSSEHRGSNHRRMMRTLAGLLLLLPMNVHAHLVETGFGPFYDGMSHLVATPEDLLVVIALALLAGLNGPRFGRNVLFALTIAWLAGGVVGLNYPNVDFWPIVTSLSFIAVGVFVVADRELSLLLVLALTCTLGLLHGYLNGAAMAQARLGLVGLLGIASAAFVLVALVTGFVVGLRAFWTRIAIRVAGAWIVAIGLLMLGWLARGRGSV
jgi:urease accessory protein